MRAGLSTIQQTLTPEAATVLTHSIAEAARRNHGQTTPLHVAATLLAAPGGLLRQACIKSHPNSSHPLQCRALELCFSVALDRLPSNPNPNPNPNNSENNPSSEPPISNALMAALKRAQAHQRRGCPEQQQSPLLAVKVELEQLVVSVLDDPSVSRVMKEASFSSPAVKATIEQSLTLSSSCSSSSAAAAAASASPSPLQSAAAAAAAAAGLGLGSRPASAMRNLYMNPRLQQQQQQQKHQLDGGDGNSKEEVKKVMEILARSKKRNPILVGDSDLSLLMREILERIEKAELGSPARIISLAKEFGSVEKNHIPAKIRELGAVIESRGEGVVVLDLGDLKWLVESNGGRIGCRIQQQQQQMMSEIGKEAVAEMGRLIAGGGGRVWALGTASCPTYMRCQVYHPSMESEWDLQAVPIAPRAPHPGLFPRLGSSNGILSSSVEALAPPKGFPAIKPATIPLRRPLEIVTDNSSQKQTLCSQCTENYERELAKLVAKEFEKSSSGSRPDQARSALPQWLQIATQRSAKPSPDQFQSKEQELNWKQSMEDLLKRWRQTCSRLHSNDFSLRSFQPKPSLPQGFPPLQLPNSSERPASPPSSPVKTDLVLGRPKLQNPSSIENAHRERIKEFPGCKQDNFSSKRTNGVASFEDSDSHKRLFKSLTEKVSWQTEAASAVTAAVLQAKSGNGKRRGLMPKADTWLLFIGSDKVGKRKMASALSELMFGVEPITVRLGNSRNEGDDGEFNVNSRGRTALDRVAEAVKQNPFSVIVLEDVDQADAVVRGTIKRAMVRGRLPDSYGREVSLGSAIFVLTANWLPDELKCSTDSVHAEEKILNSASSSWQLEISVGGKRLPDWLSKDSNPSKRKKENLSLDLNLAAGGNADDDTGEGSWNSSDLTVEHEQEHGRLAIKHAASSASEFIDSVDNAVVFKPVDFGPLRRRISESISAKFSAVMGGGRSVRIEDSVLDRIVGGAWLSGVRIEEWAERVLLPSIEQLRSKLAVDDDVAAIRLSAVEGTGRPQRLGAAGDWLPSTVRVAGI